MKSLVIKIVLVLAVGLLQARASEPRIVNIYNFIRNSDYRVSNSEDVLYETTWHQIQLLKQYKLHATWALQYDALINPRYQKLLKKELGGKDEIGAWWEIPRPMAEQAGLKWRGQHDWDSTASIGFSPGYTPDERRRLVDVYMAEFKSVFGYYPRSVGSWYIDEVTLDYMAKKYGIVASCNCKDQVGTDGYTLWGGYWNQAYYPSRLNAYMPAQTKAGQIDVPIFRMLGSDAIYQHGITPGMFTLEPVYPSAGGSASWVDWFMDGLIHQPSLAFGYTQAGQENSFGWEAMKTGLTLQMELMDKQTRAGEIQIKTLAQAGEWFRRQFPLTPATSVVYLNDWKHEDRKTVWYDSRFYRVNFFWNHGTFHIRDLHCFDENVASVTHDAILKTSYLAYETLPLTDGSVRSGNEHAGIWPELLSTDGAGSAMTPEGSPTVKEVNLAELSIEQSLQGGGKITILCCESNLTFAGVTADGKPLNWAMKLVVGDRQKFAVQSVEAGAVDYHFNELNYQLHLSPNAGNCEKLNEGEVRIHPNQAGKLIFLLANASTSKSAAF